MKILERILATLALIGLICVIGAIIYFDVVVWRSNIGFGLAFIGVEIIIVSAIGYAILDRIVVKKEE